MNIKKLNEKLEKLLEISMERYLSVEPSEYGDYFDIVLYEGNKEIHPLGGSTKSSFRLQPGKDIKDITDQNIRDMAKKDFDNITNDIRVEWRN